MSPLVSVILGSRSDWSGALEHTAATLTELGISHESKILSAHRTPKALVEYLSGIEERGIKVVIAAAGGAAHLAGAVAANILLPVLGVPMESKALGGLDSLLSTVQMPAGVPVATLAIGKAGAVNAALLAAEILALDNREIRQAVHDHRARRAASILAEPDLTTVS